MSPSRSQEEPVSDPRVTDLEERSQVHPLGQGFSRWSLQSCGFMEPPDRHTSQKQVNFPVPSRAMMNPSRRFHFPPDQSCLHYNLSVESLRLNKRGYS